MKLQIENNSSSNFMDNTDLSSDVSSANGSAEVTEMLRKGIKAAQDGNRSEARHLLMQVTELEPKNENAWLWLASISEYPEELLIFLSNVLGINPNNERALEWEKSTKSLLSKTFVQRGIEASKESQSAFAKQSFLQAIVHDDKNEMAWLWLASISDVIEEKKSHLQKVLNINPQNETALALMASVKSEMVNTLLRKAQIEALSGEHESAQKMLGEVLSQSPELEGAWMLKAFLTDSFREKVNFFEKVLELNPENEDAASCLAAMNSVMKKSEPNPDSKAVKEFDFTEQLAQTAQPEETAEVLDLQAPVETESEVIEPAPEMSEDSFNDEKDVLENEYYSTEEIANFPTQDYTISEETAQMAEETEENSPRQIEDVEEVIEMKAEVSEEPQPEMAEDEEAEMHRSFLEVEETEENVFEEIQNNVEEATESEVKQFGEMPSYQAVIEEAQSFEEEQKSEEQPEEVQFVEESVEETFSATQETAQPEEVLEQQFFEEEQKSEEVVSQTEETENTAEVPSEETEPVQFKESVVEKPKAEMVACAFCDTENEPQAFVCQSCRAILTLSDLEMMLAHQEVDVMAVQQRVEQMEIENSISKFDAQGLKMLGIGLLNMKNLRKGFEYLQEASQMTPNDVLLQSHVNSLAIRLSEIEEKQNDQDTTPKNRTILVVDDSATVRKLISAKLEKCGHEVISAVDGMEALEKINENIPDLILLDITMPRMDGYQVCKMIRGNEATKDVPVVMISGKDGFFDKVRGRMAGTTGYITKPFGPETLMKTVETYIN